MPKEINTTLDSLFKSINNHITVQVREIPLGIEDVTNYYIEHLFCDFQTLIVSIPSIKDIQNINDVSYFQNKIIVKVSNKEDIIIELNNYCISISLFGICKSTSVEIVEKIMDIFKEHINSLIEINKKILIS